jgi:hypothetical protein
VRALAIGHIAIGVLLLPLTLAGGLVAPILMAGPVWGIVLGFRLWQPRPETYVALRRTHWAFLAIDALLIWLGVWMLQAAERSAARGGGLLGGIGFLPIGLGIGLACFSLVTLVLARTRTFAPQAPSAPTPLAP